jgi:hypothetical protein
MTGTRRHLTGAVIALAGIVTAGAPAPAHAALPLSVEATFSTTKVTTSCDNDRCVVDATSTLCAGAGVNGTGLPFSGGCVARIHIVVPMYWQVFWDPRGVPHPVKYCIGGSGTFWFSNDYGVSFTGPAGTFGGMWTSGPLAQEYPLQVSGGSGTLDSKAVTCGDVTEETPANVFSGAFHYLYVA